MNRPIKLNVGGRSFATTVGTLSECAKLAEMTDDGGEEFFIDRDPEVFGRALKVLRGYPAAKAQAVEDEDVLHELSYWQHSFAQSPLPEWMQRCETRFSEVEPSIHTLDPVQSARYGRTHVLVLADVVDLLVDIRALPVLASTRDDTTITATATAAAAASFPLCRVVGAEAEWNDCRWVETALLRRAEMIVRYTIGVLGKSVVKE